MWLHLVRLPVLLQPLMYFVNIVVVTVTTRWDRAIPPKGNLEYSDLVDEPDLSMTEFGSIAYYS